MQERFSQEDPIGAGIWVARAQEMLHEVRAHLDGDINKLTAGWVLELLHDRTGAVREEELVAIRNMLTRYPAYKASSIQDGLYHYAFFRQLEFVCEATCDAYAKGLIH